MNLQKYNLEITVFLCGAIVMIFELAGARLLGPYFGTSLFVWTSIIGIILASLSLGYYLGGRVADKKPTLKNLSLVIFFAALFIVLTLIIKTSILESLQSGIKDIKLGSFLASIILFSPASILLGMISPYAAKLKINDLKNSGATVGTLYALSTAGSIVGTFLSGFVLIPAFGTNKLIILIAATLVVLSTYLFAGAFIFRVFTLVMVLMGLPIINYSDALAEKAGFIDVDTAYNRVWIVDQPHPQTGEMIRTFSINNENSSAMFLSSDELVYDYTKYYHLARHFFPDFQKTLMLGGAGYSYPKAFLKTYPEATIDVVEIDPGITELAKKYFKLESDSRLQIFHEDGRVFLNQSQDTYDVIFGDAFSSQYSLPYQLTTQETVQKKYDLLSDEGVVVLNIISSIAGESGEFLRAEYATYKSIFPQVYLFPVRDANDPYRLQNITLVALKFNETPSFYSEDVEITSYLDHLWKGEIEMDMPILTDDYAPVEHYIGKTIR